MRRSELRWGLVFEGASRAKWQCSLDPARSRTIVCENRSSTQTEESAIGTYHELPFSQHGSLSHSLLDRLQSPPRGARKYVTRFCTTTSTAHISSEELLQNENICMNSCDQEPSRKLTRERCLKYLNTIVLCILLFLQGTWIWGMHLLHMKPLRRGIASSFAYLCLIFSLWLLKTSPWVSVMGSWMFCLVFFALRLPDSLHTTILDFIKENLITFLIVCSAHVNLYLRAQELSPTAD